MDELDTFAELAERIALVTSPYEELYKYKGIEPEDFQLGCARARYHRFPLYKIDDPFDPNCAKAHWEKYHKKAIELGATANELPAKTNSPFYDLIQLGKFCSSRASGQKKDEDETKVIRFSFAPPPSTFPNNGKARDTETKQNAPPAKDEEREDVIVPKPPESLQKLLWLWKHGKQHWKLLLLAAIIMLLWFIFQLVL